jgi:hypothetical protein
LANVPPVIDTVAESCVFTPSGSLMVMWLDRVVGATSSVQNAFAATPVSVGGMSACATVTVSVCAVLRLFDVPPSLSTQVTVRVGFAPLLVGSVTLGSKVTESRTA